MWSASLCFSLFTFTMQTPVSFECVTMCKNADAKAKRVFLGRPLEDLALGGY
jgi:hypothetical protein